MEFALVVPILLGLVFGIVYFGFIFASQISLNSSARDAARTGVVQPLGGNGTGKKCSDIADAARKGASTIGITYPGTAIGVTVTSPSGTVCSFGSGVGITSSPTYDTLDICTTDSTKTRNSDNQLTILLKYNLVSPVPLMPFSTVALKATGAFQCEYS